MARPKDGMYSRFTGPTMDEVVKLWPDFATEKEADDWFKKVLKSAKFKRIVEATNSNFALIPQMGVLFEKSATACSDHVALRRLYIEVCPGRRNALQVLHVLAHYLQPATTAFHGGEFGKLYLTLVEKFLGTDTKRDVKAVLRANGIKTSVRSEETKNRMREVWYERKSAEVPERALKLLRDAKNL